MRKATLIIMAAALILLAAAVPALAYHGSNMYKNNTCLNNQCYVSENGSCIYAENCPYDGDCQNVCHLNCVNNNCVNNVREERNQQTNQQINQQASAGHHRHGAHHGRNR
ncbi:hypothetical protein [Methanimicrococcus blatticola]|uniref:Uncharacterized protein n=1 Tax=Methanimicrococcus blatticola TaxID=91560 RepID=A0A484F730_9EURY|nr:hypothetical protein [Methanimicrococcus blatticola]TDQ71263.1 hypothetical protein C7391_0370 [Methanimicrococcus blatticola]